ncbi:hypothetical protein [Segeticoccus rhizosphaerae]|uniref:hypothetical protein n=1 Tax=Segeticoccus rhizosphaerae TaxID=1104777 RepID=UPI001265453B|nr:hypothetical protein [Segeticoccus rhizosphaerae]
MSPISKHNRALRACYVAIETTARACVHLDAAAAQLDATVGDDPFDTARFLAAQLRLLSGGLHPGIRAIPDPADPSGPLEHLEAALDLLGAIRPGHAADDPTRWMQHLVDLRPAVVAATDTKPHSRSGSNDTEQP